MPIPGHHSPARRAFGGIHTPTMKQPTSMWIFPHQQAEKSLQNQHVLSIPQVGSHQLQYRLSRTKKPKSHHKTNTFCPITRIFNQRKQEMRTVAPQRCSVWPQAHSRGENNEGGSPARGLLPGGLAATLMRSLSRFRERLIPAHRGIHNPFEHARSQTDLSPLA